MNTLFIAELFKAKHGLDSLTQEQLDDLERLTINVVDVESEEEFTIELSLEDTYIGQVSWNDLKKEAMREDFEEKLWFVSAKTQLEM